LIPREMDQSKPSEKSRNAAQAGAAHAAEGYRAALMPLRPSGNYDHGCPVWSDTDAAEVA